MWGQHTNIPLIALWNNSVPCEDRPLPRVCSSWILSCRKKTSTRHRKTQFTRSINHNSYATQHKRTPGNTQHWPSITDVTQSSEDEHLLVFFFFFFLKCLFLLYNYRHAVWGCFTHTARLMWARSEIMPHIFSGCRLNGVYPSLGSHYHAVTCMHACMHANVFWPKYLLA